MPAPGARASFQLTEESLERLLRALDPDRERAGLRYQRLRGRLIWFFEFRQSAHADELADEVLNRLAMRLAEGEAVASIEAYSYGVARLLALEAARRDQRQMAAHQAYARDIQRAADTTDESLLQHAMEQCLRRRSRTERRLLADYYAGSGRAQIEARQQLATSMRLSPGALRKRVFRLREAVEACVRARLGLKLGGQ